MDDTGHDEDREHEDVALVDNNHLVKNICHDLKNNYERLQTNMMVTVCLPGGLEDIKLLTFAASCMLELAVRRRHTSSMARIISFRSVELLHKQLFVIPEHV